MEGPVSLSKTGTGLNSLNLRSFRKEEGDDDYDDM
jgi:hypothetical protein